MINNKKDIVIRITRLRDEITRNYYKYFFENDQDKKDGPILD